MNCDHDEIGQWLTWLTLVQRKEVLLLQVIRLEHSLMAVVAHETPAARLFGSIPLNEPMTIQHFYWRLNYHYITFPAQNATLDDPGSCRVVRLEIFKRLYLPSQHEALLLTIRGPADAGEIYLLVDRNVDAIRIPFRLSSGDKPAVDSIKRLDSNRPKWIYVPKPVWRADFHTGITLLDLAWLLSAVSTPRPGCHLLGENCLRFSQLVQTALLRQSSEEDALNVETRYSFGRWLFFKFKITEDDIAGINAFFTNEQGRFAEQLEVSYPVLYWPLHYR